MIDVEQIVREYIDKTVHMSLATVSENKPWVCEVHFAYDENLNLYWRSTADRRHSKEIAANSNVAGNIVPAYDLETGCGGAIYFEGTAECITDETEIRKIFPAFKKCLHKTEEIIEDALSNDGHRIYKVTVKNWVAFGKFEDQPMQRYEIAWNRGSSK